MQFKYFLQNQTVYLEMILTVISMLHKFLPILIIIVLAFLFINIVLLFIYTIL